MTRPYANHCPSIPLARLLVTTARQVSDAIPAVRSVSLTGGHADELAHPVSSRQDLTSCTRTGAVALRALSIHHWHRRKRRAESGPRHAPQDPHDPAGNQFPPPP